MAGKIALFVGTNKGGFILISDSARQARARPGQNSVPRPAAHPVR